MTLHVPRVLFGDGPGVADWAGEMYQHPVAVRVNRGGEITTVTQAGTVITQGQPFGRGVRIELDLVPELGAAPWTLAFWFHKGVVHVEAALGLHVDPTADTIWRD